MTITENDLYYMAINQPMLLRGVCKNEPNTIIELKADGFIQTQKNCTYKTKNFIIHAHNSERWNTSKIVKPINKSQVLSSKDMIALTTRNGTSVQISNPIIIKSNDQFTGLARKASLTTRAALLSIMRLGGYFFFGKVKIISSTLKALGFLGSKRRNSDTKYNHSSLQRT